MVIVILVFLAALVAVFLVFVPGQGLDSCVVVWFLFLLLFWLALSLLSWLLFLVFAFVFLHGRFNSSYCGGPWI